MTVSEAETVRFPMSYFAEDPVAFRRAFHHERNAFLEQRSISETRQQAAVVRSMRNWGCMKLLSEEGRNQLFEYKSDMLKLGSARNVDDIPIPRYSPGLRFGRPIHQPDYLLGASVVMTAQRAAAIVGVENFDGQWLLTARDLANPADAPRDIAWFGAAHKRLSEEIPDYHYGSYLNFNSFAKVAP